MENLMTDSSPEVTSQQDTSSDSSFAPTQGGVQGREGLTPSQVYELDKLERFKFEGRDLTPAELKKAMLRQEDYTRKTQDLSKERESFQTERKFYENLYADLNHVRQNPHLASEFIKVYPQKFHGELNRILQETGHGKTQESQQQVQSQKFDYETENRLSQLEKYFFEQDVSKNELKIQQNLDRLSQKYPDADREMVIGRVADVYNKLLAENPKAELTEQIWEDAYKQVDAKIQNLINTKYKDRIQKQLEANQKSKAPSGAGGVVGRAPQKFNKLKDVTEYAVKDLTGRS